MSTRPTTFKLRNPSGARSAVTSTRAAIAGRLRNPATVVGLLLVATLSRVEAQEVPRPSITRQKVKQALPTAGNLRLGPVLLRVDANLTTEFVDNVNLGPAASEDIIITPSLGVTAIWPMTRQNTLRFRTSIGYLKYINNSVLDRQNLVISPDSALSFDIYSGDFRFNFHEQFSYQLETVSQGALAGVAQLPRFTNTVGASVLWDMNDVIWTIGYDHFDFITVGDAASTQGVLAQNTGQLDHSTDQVSTSASFKLSSVAIGGLEVVGSTSNYPDSSSADFSSLSVGPYIEYQLTPYTHLFVSGGYKLYSGSGGGAAAPGTLPGIAGNQSGFYAGASIVHTLNRYYRDRLDFGRSDEFDAFNGRAQTSYVRYSGTWELNQKMSLGIGLSYEDVNLVTGSLFNGGLGEKYSRIGASLSTAYRLTEHLDVGLAYRYTNRDSTIALLSFSQNSLTISLGYRF